MICTSPGQFETLGNICTPAILGNLAAAGDTIIEKLERYLGDHGNVGFACVLPTADDEGFTITATSGSLVNTIAATLILGPAGS